MSDSAVSYPGVYVVEVPGNPTVVPAIPTSLTCFIGRTVLGEVATPIIVKNMGEFEAEFGGMAEQFPLSYAVNDFFNNGGAEAIIVRLYGGPSEVARINALMKTTGGFQGAPIDKDELPALTNKTTPNGCAQVILDSTSVPTPAKSAAGYGFVPPPAKQGKTGLVLCAASPGAWGNYLTVSIDANGISDAAANAANVKRADLFNITTTYAPPTGSPTTERITNVTVDPEGVSSFQITKKLATLSTLITCGNVPTVAEMQKLLSLLPAIKGKKPNELDTSWPPCTNGLDAYFLTSPLFYTGGDLEEQHAGLYSLEKADIFNLLVIPRDQPGSAPHLVISDVLSYMEKKRAFWIMEAPPGSFDDAIRTGSGIDDLLFGTYGTLGELGRYGAVYWPDVLQPDPLAGQYVDPDGVGPGGMIAGTFARTDAERGVWKAPAGTKATLAGAYLPVVKVNDDMSGTANPVGINCIRYFSDCGTVIWGSRTLQGADAIEDQYKYIPVRRLTNYIEESIFRALHWTVFEPNAEPLWSAIRLQITGFMTSLMKQGAFQGATQKDAFFVNCDASTTTPDDITNGTVNVVIGFAPVKPAEFVVLYFQPTAVQSA